jgi:carbamoylphosphate synthase large subunit
MSRARVWFSRASSSLHPLLLSLKHTPLGKDLGVVCSHASWDAPALCAADEVYVEPSELKGAAYAEWCLEFCRHQNIQVLMPGKARSEVAALRQEFEAAGTRLVVAGDRETLRLLEQKPEFLAQVPPELAPVSTFTTVNTLAEFKAAVAAIRATGAEACFKPAVSTYGLGFYVLQDELSPLNRLLEGHPYRISFAEACTVLGSEPEFRDVMVMEYLSGTEYSVDVVGRDGEVAAAVVRTKYRAASATEGTAQQVGGDEPEIQAMVRSLARHFRLGGLFNMQFCTPSGGGRPRLLEINGRMSGGLALACLAGTHLLELALRIAIEGPDVPLPRVEFAGMVRAQQGFCAFPVRHLPLRGKPSDQT